MDAAMAGPFCLVCLRIYTVSHGAHWSAFDVQPVVFGPGYAKFGKYGGDI